MPTHPPRRTRLSLARPRLEELEPRLPPATDLFVVAGTAGAATGVRFDWVMRLAAFNNEIGVYRVADDAGTVAGLRPGQAGYADAALANGQVVFRAGQGTGATATLNFLAGDRLAFYLVQNNTTDAARAGAAQVFFSVDGANADGVEHVQSGAQSDGGLRLGFEDLTGGGDNDFNDAIITVGGSGLLATPGQAGQTVSATFGFLSRDADFANEIGLFRVEDAQGRVGGLLPGAAGYARAALSSPTRQVIFAQGEGAGASRTLTLEAGARYGFYLAANSSAAAVLSSNPDNAPGGPIAFFSLAGANPDGRAHADWVTPGTIGFEDLFGAGDSDFNDAIIQVQFGAVAGTPTPPAPPPPTDTTAPALAAQLSTDTFDPARVTPPNDTRADGITANAAISGTVTDASPISIFLASVDSTLGTDFDDISDVLQPNGTFALSRARLEAIAGAPLADGPHTVRLRASDAAGNVSATVEVAFTLDTRATATLLLDAADDTGTTGELRTDTATVTLTGTTEAGATVSLRRNTGAGFVEIATSTAGASGQFSFDTALAVGPNALKVFVTDAAGNVGESGATLTLNQAPTVAAPIGTVTVPADAAPTTIDLANVFADADNSQPVVRFDTVFGPVLVQLFEGRAPRHVANFLSYATSGGYDTTFIHRVATGFVVQGGGFRFVNGGTPNFVDTPENAPVLNEPGLPNSRGTIALAKQPNNPNSGTDEWFFSLADNVANLDNQNGGFTVFGQVIGTGQQVLDAIAGVPTFDLTPFESVPLRNNFTGTTIQDATANNFVLVNGVARLANPLTYSVVSNSNEAVVTAAVVNGQLQLTPAAGATGTATVVVRATDPDGTSVTDTVTVRVGV